MKEPQARSMRAAKELSDVQRHPRAYTPTAVAISDIDTVLDAELPAGDLPLRPRKNLFLRLFLLTGGLLVSLAIGVAIDFLIRDLFAMDSWLGWVGVGIAGLFVLAAIALAIREAAALLRLRSLDHLRGRATAALENDDPIAGKLLLADLAGIYAGRADLANARHQLHENRDVLFDGADMVQFAERTLMNPLDAKAKALTAASARRVALVTAVSPRALVDIAFVAYESVRLAGAVAALYGARPGFFGFWRLTGAVLGHLAITGGLALTDGVMEQLIGQGLAAKLSARLGEGLVNGLMTVRVGIAAMRVVRPLPFAALKQPLVKDFIPELANLSAK